jgi:hypothetical protein
VRERERERVKWTIKDKNAQHPNNINIHYPAEYATGAGHQSGSNKKL